MKVDCRVMLDEEVCRTLFGALKNADTTRAASGRYLEMTRDARRCSGAGIRFDRC